MQNTSLDTQLDLFESQLNALSASLLEGYPDTLVSGSAALQRLAVDLVRVTGGKGLEQLKQPRQRRRVRVLATGLANLRENLLRQMAYVDRALEIVVPATRDKSTYAGSGAYGQPVRQSGAFSVLAA